MTGKKIKIKITHHQIKSSEQTCFSLMQTTEKVYTQAYF